MDESRTLILTMQYEDGTQGKKELLSIFAAENGRDYAALLPLNDDRSVVENASIELVRVKKFLNDEEQEDYLIEGITTDAELQTAKEAFEQLDLVVADDLNETSVDDLPTISFKTNAGVYEDWKIVDVFTHRDRQYAALIPVEQGKPSNNINIHLMRMEFTTKDGIEGCEVENIPSDMEYDEVAAVFEARVGKANS